AGQARVELSATDLPQVLGATDATSVISNAAPGTVASAFVRIDDLPHAFVGDLDITLTSPGGTDVVLMSGDGGGGDNLVGTVFEDVSPAIDGTVAADAPFNGCWGPEESLGVLSGQDGSGDWTLFVDDTYPSLDNGSLNAWTLILCVQ